MGRRPAASQAAVRLADVEARCRALGIPLTVQRRAVLRSLATRFDHPTPEDVHGDVLRACPGMSRGTVYRTLDTLAARGLIVRVSHPGSAGRFDAHVARHHHVLCDACGAMRDFDDPDLDRIRLPRRLAAGFQVKDYSVHVRGLCAYCAPGRKTAAASRRGTAIRRKTR